MSAAETLGLALALLGAGFFLAGSVGLLRFPDALCRLHALAKADGMGLALTLLGAAAILGSWSAAAKLALIWALVALSGATTSHLVARHVRRAGQGEGRP